MHRRKFIASSTAIISAISGCIGNITSQESSQIGLGEIKMTNVLEDNIDAEITVEKDDSRIYHENHELSGTTDGPAENIEIQKEWMGEVAEYVVSVSTNGGEIENVFSSNAANEMYSDWGDNDCFSLSVTPEEDDIYFAVGALETCP